MHGDKEFERDEGLNLGGRFGAWRRGREGQSVGNLLAGVMEDETSKLVYKEDPFRKGAFRKESGQGHVFDLGTVSLHGKENAGVMIYRKEDKRSTAGNTIAIASGDPSTHSWVINFVSRPYRRNAFDERFTHMHWEFL